MLVGAGIGLTPFASILALLVHRAKAASKCPHCSGALELGRGKLRKVYMIIIVRIKEEATWVRATVR